MKITRALFLRKSDSMKNSFNVSLVNKCWSDDLAMKVEDVISILHTAVEFRNADKDAKIEQLKIPDLHRKSITLLLRRSSELLEASFFSAGQFLKVPTNKLILPEWDSKVHVLDTRKIFEKHTDCLFCESKYLSRSRKIIDNSPIPVLFVRSCKYRIILGLAQLMTTYLRFGNLTGLNLLWIGPPCSTLNTLLAFCPKLRVNFIYYCGFNTFAPASPSCLEYIKQQYVTDSQKFQCRECNMVDLKDILPYVDVIITTKQQNSALKITKDIMSHTKPECIILHTLHRGSFDIEDELFEQKNCLVWDMVANTKWIFAAFMVRLLADYEHITQQPMFDNPSKSNNENNVKNCKPTFT